MDTPQHVLVGYDGSPLSELALHRAFRMVEHSTFALIHVVCVVDEGPGDAVRIPAGHLMTRWAALESVRLIVKGETEALRVRYPQARMIVHLRTGDVASALVDFAYRFHIDQIVVGAHGRSTHGSSTVGSVSNKLLTLTDIPTHIESPLGSVPPPAPGNPLRWAYIASDRRPNDAAGYPMRNKERARA